MKQSAGLLLYRRQSGDWQVLLAHPGGPFWAKKDAGAWSIPKGEFVEGEEPQAAARREFQEELGRAAPEGELTDLGSSKQSSGKMVYIWAQTGDFDTAHIASNTMKLEWPPRSGTMQDFPEVDRAAWYGFAEARRKLVKGQVVFIDRLAEHLGVQETPQPQQATLF